MDFGEWTENSRGTYNKWDGIARSTIQVSLLMTYSSVMLEPGSRFAFSVVRYSTTMWPQDVCI